MRLTWLASLFVFLGCSNDFSADGGPDSSSDNNPGIDVNAIEGGNPDVAQDTTPNPMHRLFVGNGTQSSSGVVAWDGADTISSDRAPDVSIGDNQLKGMIMALELAGDRLFAFNEQNTTLFALDKAGTLTSNSTVAVALGPSAFGGVTPHVSRVVFSDPMLFTSDNNSATAVQYFKNAKGLTSSDTSAGRFGGNMEGFASIARDAKNDRIFGGSINASVVRYANNISNASGNIAPSDFGGGGNTFAWAMVADDTRLYVFLHTSTSALQLNIYNLSNVMPGAQPDAILTKNLPLTNGFPVDLAIANDTLVGAYRDAQNKGHVAIWAGAKTLGNSSDKVELTNDDISPTRIRLSAKTGLLYTVGKYKGNAGVTIWKNITGAPSLQAELTTGLSAPKSIAIYEP